MGNDHTLTSLPPILPLLRLCSQCASFLGQLLVSLTPIDPVFLFDLQVACHLARSLISEIPVPSPGRSCTRVIKYFHFISTLHCMDGCHPPLQPRLQFIFFFLFSTFSSRFCFDLFYLVKYSWRHSGLGALGMNGVWNIESTREPPSGYPFPPIFVPAPPPGFDG